MKNPIIHYSIILSLPSISRQLEHSNPRILFSPRTWGFALAHNTDQNISQHLSSQPLKAQQFAKAKKFHTSLVPETRKLSLSTDMTGTPFAREPLSSTLAAPTVMSVFLSLEPIPIYASLFKIPGKSSKRQQSTLLSISAVIGFDSSRTISSRHRP